MRVYMLVDAWSTAELECGAAARQSGYYSARGDRNMYYIT
jgi:hypothetical protein